MVDGGDGAEARASGWAAHGTCSASLYICQNRIQGSSRIISPWSTTAKAKWLCSCAPTHTPAPAATSATLYMGLPIPGATTAHGTAFDIAGKGVADPGSLRAALRSVVRLAG